MFSIELSRQEFGTKLNHVVSPSRPIQSVEHLQGRSNELRQIEQALFMDGRHVFIFGDRGVDKSSVAATAANQYQSSDSEYIDVSGSPDATFKGIVANICYQALRASRTHKVKRTTNASFEPKYFKQGSSTETTLQDLHAEIRSIADATALLKEVASLHSDRPIVVLDEFDRIKDDNERSQFADLLKQMGDKNVPLKFIFTGVGSTIEQLLGAHPSAIRQLETIELPRLSWDSLWEIVRRACDQFGVVAHREVEMRIAAVSDGFPYYVHLLTEKLLWHLFTAQEAVTLATLDHYWAALIDAINGINADLRKPYEKAISRNTTDIEEVLWSTANTDLLQRYLRDMNYSYRSVMSQRSERVSLSQDKYSARIRALKTRAYGEILVGDPHHQGLYTYREKMLRGYVRMQAEANGVELVDDRNASRGSSTMHVPAMASRGYRGPTIPKGVKFPRSV